MRILLVILCSAIWLGGAQNTSGQAVAIVGTGAARCSTYLDQIAKNPLYEREYFAWAQGFMSGLVMGAPSGKHENLQLNPPQFPVREQFAFLREYCATRYEQGFTDGVIALFAKLRTHSQQY